MTTLPPDSREDEIEQERRRSQSRLKDMLADQAGRKDFGDISSLLRNLLSLFLPPSIVDLLFPQQADANGNDIDAPNESPEDAQPQTTGERVRAASRIIASGARGNWEKFQRERQGETVTHINPSGDGAQQTSGFGPRESRRTTNGRNMSSNHAGLDLVGTSDIRASADGVVLFAGRRGGYGNLVIIGHADGSETRYGHMTGRNMPREGATVKQRDVIGEMGATGNVTGAHLHYEQRRDDGNGRMVAHAPRFGKAEGRQTVTSLSDEQRRVAVDAAGPLAKHDHQQHEDNQTDRIRLAMARTRTSIGNSGVG